MIRMTSFFRYIWRIYFFVVGLLLFLLLCPFYYYLCTNEKRFKAGFYLKKKFCHILCFLTGVRPDVHFEEPLDPNQAYVICANHSSYIDIILTFGTIPVYFHMMAKAELKKIPLFNVFFIMQDIPVDRGSMKASHRAFVRSGEDIDKGYSIAIFPEATIPDHTPRLARFKNGPFKLAIDKQVSIIPVTFIDNWRILPDGRKSKHGGRPGKARIIVHKPVRTKGLHEDDLDALKKEVFDTIDGTIRKHFA